MEEKGEVEEKEEEEEKLVVEAVIGADGTQFL